MLSVSSLPERLTASSDSSVAREVARIRSSRGFLRVRVVCVIAGVKSSGTSSFFSSIIMGLGSAGTGLKYCRIEDRVAASVLGSGSAWLSEFELDSESSFVDSVVVFVDSFCSTSTCASASNRALLVGGSPRGSGVDVDFLPYVRSGLSRFLDK